MTSIRSIMFVSSSSFLLLLMSLMATSVRTAIGFGSAYQLCPNDGFCPQARDKYAIVCYYTDWSSRRNGKGAYMPEDVIDAPCTHVIYSFAFLNSTLDGIEPGEPSLAYDEHFYERITALKIHKLKVLLALAGWTDSTNKYSTMMADEKLRMKVANHAAQFLVLHNMDGLNLDIEYPGAYQGNIDPNLAQDKDNFIFFLRDLRQAFDEIAGDDSLSLSIAVSANGKIIDVAYDIAGLVAYCEWIGVMTYDFFGNWDKVTGLVAPFQPQPGDAGDAAKFNVMSAMKVWLDKGVPAEKLLVGFPCYGRSFGLDDENKTYIKAPASGTPEPGEFTKSSGTLAFYEIIDNAKVKNWNVVHETCLGSYAYRQLQWVGYDDTLDAAVKANYVKQKCFGGVMFWSLDNECFQADCPTGKYPLIRTVHDILYDLASLSDVCNIT